MPDDLIERFNSTTDTAARRAIIAEGLRSPDAVTRQVWAMLGAEWESLPDAGEEPRRG